MNRVFLSVSILLFTVSGLAAQNLESGIELYEEGNYENALRIFESINSPEAHLFAGKSYFAMNNFLKAKSYLKKVNPSSNEIFEEAKFTTALADFQLKNFSLSLDHLFEINESTVSASISRSAYDFYNKLINYLTLEQRWEAFKASKYDEVRFDLVEAAIGNVNRGSAQALLNAYKNGSENQANSELAAIEELVADSAAYAQRYLPDRYPTAPSGISYNIGVLLPEFDIESAQFEVPQHLFFGIQLAVENFNSVNTDKKAFITYRDSQNNSAGPQGIVNDLIWNHQTDAIIGPLFSEVAAQVAQLSEEYEIPVVTPLANSDSINIDYNYTFQLNPTFSVQGKKMARFAIQELGYDTLAVLAEKGSLGEPSAHAFLDESRALGAEVVRYFVEDFASEGYDITEYVEVFDPEVDTVFNYNIDAVYAPFTGNIAQTLVSSLLTSLEAIETEMTILGSEEWESVSTDDFPQSELEVFYTKTFEIDESNLNISEFESSFRMRFDTAPNQFAYIGFDAANIILETLTRVENPEYLKEGLKSVNNYRGLSTNISFDGEHINQEVKIKEVRKPED